VQAATLEIDALCLRRVLYADALVPPDIAGLTVAQVQAVPWRVPQWGEGEEIRASASAWVVDAGGRRLVLDPMQAADGVLHDPVAEQDHQRAISEVFDAAGIPRTSVDTVVASHVEGIGMICERGADGSWRPFFPNARVLISEAALEYFRRGVISDDSTPVWQRLFDDDLVDTFADGDEIVPGMRAEVSAAHNPGHTVFHFGAGPKATFVGHLAVSPLHLATGLCPQQHPEPERAWELLRSYADDGRLLIGPLWPSPGFGRWSEHTFSSARS
jgi:glyoxylase-like metal-dependent hydrolase (beta-lactamase superfamily II)